MQTVLKRTVCRMHFLSRGKNIKRAKDSQQQLIKKTRTHVFPQTGKKRLRLQRSKQTPLTASAKMTTNIWGSYSNDHHDHQQRCSCNLDCICWLGLALQKKQTKSLARSWSMLNNMLLPSIHPIQTSPVTLFRDWYTMPLSPWFLH